MVERHNLLDKVLVFPGVICTFTGGSRRCGIIKVILKDVRVGGLALVSHETDSTDAGDRDRSVIQKREPPN